MKRFVCIAATLVLTQLAFAQPASIRPEKLEIDRLMQRWSEAIAKEDLQAIGDLVTEDVEFWGEGTPAIIGRATVISTFTETFSRFRLAQTIEEKGRDWDESFVVIRGIESTKIAQKPLLKSNEMRRRVVMVIRREADGKWRIARGMSNLPPRVQ